MAAGRRRRGTGEHTQAQRHEKVQCSSHDATHTLILSPDGKLSEHWATASADCSMTSQHTLAYVPSLDKAYSFGEEEQLGDKRKPNQLIPLPIDSPVNTGKSYWAKKKSQKVTGIIAQGNKSIVLRRKKNSYVNGIATLKHEDMGAWISDCSSQHWKSVKKNIGLIFSSEACINGSFLEKRDKHFKTSREVSGVDMSEVQRFYVMISKKPKVFQEVQKEIEKLLPSLSSSPISPENFRVYLILPFLLQGEDDSSYRSLGLLAQAIMKLRPQDLQTLGRAL
ncbi:probable E3 ubiquitin-protein ligase HERC4 [Grus japonensis]|uniref:Probable E3 ubiquitin-protein ligase HERC4 n=1 Tax=Grus japonensis TaxID=30415 RepID=A0ABC9WTR4_GRUJA